MLTPLHIAYDLTSLTIEFRRMAENYAAKSKKMRFKKQRALADDYRGLATQSEQVIVFLRSAQSKGHTQVITQHPLSDGTDSYTEHSFLQQYHNNKICFK